MTAPKCPPCNSHCNQGRTCPARPTWDMSQLIQQEGGCRIEHGDAGIEFYGAEPEEIGKPVPVALLVLAVLLLIAAGAAWFIWPVLRANLI